MHASRSSLDEDRARLPQAVLDAADEVAALANTVESGRFALGLSGSTSTGTSDALSDVDFRCYSDASRPQPTAAWEADWDRLFRRWEQRGISLDGLGWETVGHVDELLGTWLVGDGVTERIRLLLRSGEPPRLVLQRERLIELIDETIALLGEESLPLEL